MNPLKFFLKPQTAHLPDQIVTDEMLAEDMATIHDKLMEEVNSILATPQYSEEEVKTLQAIWEAGFYNSTSYREAADKLREITEAQETRDYISLYSVVYPNNRFITKSCVDKICNKYGLIRGMSCYYIAEIPVENMKHIQNFKVREWDVHYNRASYDIVDRGPEPETHNWIAPAGVQIIAPKHKFDLGERAEVVGNEIRLKDPIVLQPVKGGYLIITAWGIEAADPEIRNARHN